jgi:hypothetical protein
MQLMVRPKRAIPTQQLSVRLESPLVAELDRLAADLERLSVGGLPVSRIDVVRAAIERGVQSLRTEADAQLMAQSGRKAVASRTARSTARQAASARGSLKK